MVKLKPGKSLTRETSCTDSHRPIVVELHSGHLVLRLKGQGGESYFLEWGEVLKLARMRKRGK
jgi:hypothetical protein